MARVLLVEDVPYNRNVYMDHLLGGGHDVLCAATGHDGIALLKTHPFDVAVVDVWLPQNMSGLRMIEMAQDLDIPVKFIIMTGGGPNASIYETQLMAQLTAGPDGIPIIEKPFDKEDILNHINQVLASK
jgi:CheY-like chemotaxis protein